MNIKMLLKTEKQNSDIVTLSWAYFLSHTWQILKILPNNHMAFTCVLIELFCCCKQSVVTANHYPQLS